MVGAISVVCSVHKPGHLSRGGWPSNDPMCDQCGRWRNRGDHRECSRERKRLNEAAEAGFGDHQVKR